MLKSECELKEFRRFNKIGNGTVNWTVSLNDWDAIIFEAKRDLWVYGVGIYRPKYGSKHDFKIRYKWTIEDTPNGETIEESKEYEECGKIPDRGNMVG